MLVPDVSQEVSAIDVVPSPLVWEGIDGLEGLDDDWLWSVLFWCENTSGVFLGDVSSSDGGGGDECASECSHVVVGIDCSKVLIIKDFSY